MVAAKSGGRVSRPTRRRPNGSLQLTKARIVPRRQHGSRLRLRSCILALGRSRYRMRWHRSVPRGVASSYCGDMSNSNPDRRSGPARRKPVQLNLRVSDHARELLERIADKHGFNLTHALEYSIRQTAISEGVWLDESRKAPIDVTHVLE